MRTERCQHGCYRGAAFGVGSRTADGCGDGRLARAYYPVFADPYLLRPKDACFPGRAAAGDELAAGPIDDVHALDRRNEAPSPIGEASD